MKSYKFKIGILTGLMMVGVLLSCDDDFLTRTPQGQYSPDALRSLDGVKGLLIGAYAMLDGQGLDGQ
ncbi:MAG: hypothetical protein ACI9IP_000884, partial [Arcticibacterium sp.]